MARKKKASSKHHAKPHDQKSLSEFYTDHQRKEEQKEKFRKEHEQIEAEIFEHLKEHTKMVLKHRKMMGK